MHRFSSRILAASALSLVLLAPTATLDAKQARPAAPGVAGVPLMISAKSPESVAAAIRSKGWQAVITATSDGTPMITTTIPGSKGKWYVKFFECDAAMKNCLTLNFYQGFLQTKANTHQAMNQYNQNARWTRAYIDNEGDPVIEMDLDLDFKGMPRENFLEYLNTWQESTTSFKNFVYATG